MAGVVLCLVITACAAASEGEFAQTVSSAPEEFDRSFAAEEPMRNDVSSDFVGEAVPVERMVIQTANLSIVVDSPSDQIRRIADMAEEMGGYVVSSNLYQASYSDLRTTAEQGSITIRVPADQMTEAMQRIKGEWEVPSENVSGQDVTQQYTDLQSRLRNLEATEAQLLSIMEAAGQAKDFDAVLQVNQSLRQITEEIEVIKGQMQYLSESARLSSISVDLIPDVAAQPLQIGGWSPEVTAKDAFEMLVRGLRFLGDTAIWVLICVVPAGLLFGLPGWFVFRSVQRRRKQEKESA
jgi:hypothetical protein